MLFILSVVVTGLFSYLLHSLSRDKNHTNYVVCNDSKLPSYYSCLYYLEREKERERGREKGGRERVSEKVREREREREQERKNNVNRKTWRQIDIDRPR